MDKFNGILKEIEKFYYSSFWTNRFKRRMKEEGEEYIPIQLDIIQGITSELVENTQFKIVDRDPSINGISDSSSTITLNSSIAEEKISNTIMHELGHKQYSEKGFRLIIELNKRIIGEPEIEGYSESDTSYITDHNEIRQRIIPIIKEMFDNGWTLSETYDKSVGLKLDSIKNVYTRSYILKLIDNLL